MEQRKRLQRKLRLRKENEIKEQRIDEFVRDKELQDYPLSKNFVVGFNLWADDNDDVDAMASFKKGAENDGCVACMFLYRMTIPGDLDNTIHLKFPWALESSIRGDITSMSALVGAYREAKPVPAYVLCNFWAKTMIELGNIISTEEFRKEQKTEISNECFVCRIKDSKDVTLHKCAICKYYSYCGKHCQSLHWKELKHMNECRHVIFLRKYCKPQYVKEIREAIIGGQDPKDIDRLQRLRMKLGLDRPKEEYKELLFPFENNNNNNDDDNTNTRINSTTPKPGTIVKIVGLLEASKHNGTLGIVTNVLIPGEGGPRVGVKLYDDTGAVLAIKINNLESAATRMINNNNNINHSSSNEYLVGRKDGTVHIGSLPGPL